jgi:hypothetical protein
LELLTARYNVRYNISRQEKIIARLRFSKILCTFTPKILLRMAPGANPSKKIWR